MKSSLTSKLVLSCIRLRRHNGTLFKPKDIDASKLYVSPLQHLHLLDYPKSALAFGFQFQITHFLYFHMHVTKINYHTHSKHIVGRTILTHSNKLVKHQIKFNSRQRKISEEMDS